SATDATECADVSASNCPQRGFYAERGECLVDSFETFRLIFFHRPRHGWEAVVVVSGVRVAVPSDESALLVASGISKRFGGVAALTDACFDLRPGEIHALMGENGAGKSTLMKILAGIYSSYEGQIALDERPVSFANVRQAEAAGIAIIHQELNLVPELTVADN